MRKKDFQGDRRVRRTKKMFKKACILLMQEKEYQRITVTDIVEKADYNRATFYLHYKYKEELIDEIISEMLNGLINATLHPYKQTNNQNLFAISPYDVILFDFILENKDFFKLWNQSPGIPGFLDQFVRFVENFFKEEFKHRVKAEINIDLYVSFLAYGTLGLILDWIKSDFADSPQYMAGQLIDILQYHPAVYVG